MRTLSTENSYLFNRILLDIVFPLPSLYNRKEHHFQISDKEVFNYVDCRSMTRYSAVWVQMMWTGFWKTMRKCNLGAGKEGKQS